MSLRFRAAAFGVAAAIVAAAPVCAATECKTQFCAATCLPAPPVGISTLVAADQFPDGAERPLAFVDPGDGRGRRLIATHEGAILVWNGIRGEIEPTLFLDLREVSGGPVRFNNEQGLVSLLVDPDYRTNGLFYVFYIRRDLGPGTKNDLVIERYQRSAANPDVADPASATPILVIDHPDSEIHSGGTLAWGPNDGFLYISIGDGGPQCDGDVGTSGHAQSVTTLLGKLLRIDVRNVDPKAGDPDDCALVAGPYKVPSGNPFAGVEPACDEIWGMGLRNPFRFTFDRDTGDLWLGDVGSSKWEELNLVPATMPAPVNFGWVCREACDTSGNDESECSTAGCPVDPGTSCEFPFRTGGFRDPVLCHYNGGWHSIMAGYRYRGLRVPSIAGSYFYSDAACGQIWKTTTLDPANPAAIDSACWASGFHGDYGFAEDGLGELYVLVGGGSRIDCIHDGEGCGWADYGLFEDGFESAGLAAWSFPAP